MWLLLTMVVLGCGEEEEDPLEDLSCEELSMEQCDLREDCMVAQAKPIEETEDGWCYDLTLAWVDIGCTPGDCGTMSVDATTVDQPDDCLWYFPNVCLPEGYIACPADQQIKPCN